MKYKKIDFTTKNALLDTKDPLSIQRLIDQLPRKPSKRSPFLWWFRLTDDLSIESFKNYNNEENF